MKLVAIWVEEYLKIVNAGFNFGSRFTFKFSFDAEERRLRINPEETPDFYDLFATDNIVNITGVIGANGSGKTSLLKLLSVMDAGAPLRSSVVSIFESDGKFRVFIYGQLITNKAVRIDIALNYENLFEGEASGFPVNNVDLIFYSNLYSPGDNYKQLNVDDKLNRSVSYQTAVSLRPARVSEYIHLYHQEFRANAIDAEASFNLLSLYDSDKLQRLILFLSEVNVYHTAIKHVVERIKFPKYLNLVFKSDFLAAVKTPHENSKLNSELLVSLYSQSYEKNHVFEMRKRLENEILIEIFFYAIYNDLSLQAYGDRLSRLENFLSGLVDENDKLRLVDDVFLIFRNYLLDDNKESKFASISVVRDFIRQMPVLLEPLKIKRDDYLGYQVEIDENCWAFVSKLLEIKSVTLDHIVDVGFDPLSAGENAILNQFAEFYQAFKYLEKHHVIVAIDEGELYLHPDWQREYVDSLYSFFKFYSNLNGADRTFQLIITSHSPFVVSDIPRQSLVFLEKNQDGGTLVSESKQHLPTFGGNLFELFNDGFFLKEFVSGFAYKKIDDAIAFLDGNEQHSFSDVVSVEAFTKLIGESLIREELEKLIWQKKRGFNNYFEIYEGQDDRIVEETPKRQGAKQKKPKGRGKRK